MFYSDTGVSDFLPKILSIDDNPKHPNASIATASTNGVDGAMCPSLKLFWYNVIVNDIVHNRPHKRFMDTTPFSSENKLFNELKNSFIVLVIYLTINITQNSNSPIKMEDLQVV
jgi:hypothetical protein